MSRPSHSCRVYVISLYKNKNCKLITRINKKKHKDVVHNSTTQVHANFINFAPQNGVKRNLVMIFLQDRNTSVGGGGYKGVICVGWCVTGFSVPDEYYQTLPSVPPVNLLRHNLSTERQATPSRRPTSRYVNSMAELRSTVVFQSVG